MSVRSDVHDRRMLAVFDFVVTNVLTAAVMRCYSEHKGC